ncbi:hypothetical protein [Moraxella equi]|uniref:Uncharacterized protein n=1 Tax=Moraxella equi TaxID=60442 RepID=A0A378QVS5_9GAMM|nr:hypothetical protein [Moraxella equi]OPH39574.1 hypothetical protein B5J93_03620 [Moraxella equi]STZ04394.1 Uncharacterised protein [Moraxella equi]
MNLDKMTVNIKPLPAYQAMDLGLSMARHWYYDLWRLWWMSHVPVLCALIAVMAGLNYIFYDDDELWSLLSVVLFWWVKPIFERELVIYLGHRLFDDDFGMDDVKRVAMPSVMFLLIRRFGLRRMMVMPVHLLERQSGKFAKQRVTVLSRRQDSAIGWHAMAVFVVEMVLYAVSVIVLTMMFGLGSSFGEGEQTQLPKLLVIALDVMVYVGVVAMLTPFYVASGFAMYLCKRSLLEGWDIEIVFRKLLARHHAINNNHVSTNTSNLRQDEP